MTDNELKVLHQVAISLGIPTTELSVRNPFELKGKRAELLQTEIAQKYPEQAAAWRKAAGGELSLACQMAERGLIEHTQSTKKELWEKDPTYVAQQQAANQKAEAEMLAKWDKEASDLREKRTGRRELDERPNFLGYGHKLAGSMERQWEYEQAMKGQG